MVRPSGAMEDDDVAKRTEMHKSSRRAFVKKAAYVAPAILTLAAAPRFATAGSGKGGPPKGRPPGKGPPPGKGK